jgi:hypothetical protein
VVTLPRVDTGADCGAGGDDRVVERGGCGDRVVESGVETPFRELGPEISGPRPRFPVSGPHNCPVLGLWSRDPDRTGRIPGSPAGPVAESWISVVSRLDLEQRSTTRRPICPRHRSTTPRRADPTTGVALTDQVPACSGWLFPRDPRSCVLPWSGRCESRGEAPEGTPKAPLTHAAPTSTITQRRPRNHDPSSQQTNPHPHDRRNRSGATGNHPACHSTVA